MNAVLPGPLLVHVGYHKTGTTFLQRRVFSDRSMGFLSESRCQSNLATREFLTREPLSFDASSARAAFMPMLEEAWSAGLLPVISQERLTANPEQGQYWFPWVFDRLVETFGPFRVLVTIREQRGMLMALYRQAVRAGSALTLREALGTGNEPPGWGAILRPEYLLYDRLVEHVAARCGDDAVCVLPMEWLRRDPDAYLARLCSFCGVSPSGKPEMASENTGYSVLATAIARRLAWLGRPNPLGPQQSASMRFKRSLVYQIDRVLPKSWSDGIDARWRSMIADRVGRMYAESNQRLSDRLGMELGEFGYDTGF